MKTPASFFEYTTHTVFRVPIYDDGTVGSPEYLKGWTGPAKNIKKGSTAKKSNKVKAETVIEEEVLL